MSLAALAVESGDVEWGVTPEVLLFAGAAVMSIAVIAFGVWLFVRASREGTQPPENPGS